ncbi:V-type ATP synthase subunit E [Aerococcus kribbianus]|uniref:V-type ATP synthase subunit E n=1 Tax=Aerococcus kribbianus TaxID=2999064 RepID=A0A9X3FVJ9_9LACT|nr:MULTISPECIES: V-type ATP synthase subunit E [unclassified Aerococcus]MCZ0717029.1 V-type ATP synthase subunit E [Aerococcus sp. YH-aer221]MCZ0725317.1 V-type ATP synthase subunit E [Aerococcus sp. YH-aer222]
MELEEKLAFFDKQVMKEANGNINQQISQYQDTLQKDFDDYQEKLQKNYSQRLENEKTNTRKEINKEISQTQIKQQRDLFVEEEKLKKSLFERFRNEIKDYMTKSDYHEQLQAMITSIADFAGQEDYVIYVDPKDQELASTLLAPNKGTIKVSDRDFIGGVRGVLTARNILVDYSFSTLLANEEENFILKEVDASERN